MHLLKIISIFIFTLLFSFSVFAQDKDPDKGCDCVEVQDLRIAYGLLKNKTIRIVEKNIIMFLKSDTGESGMASITFVHSLIQLCDGTQYVFVFAYDCDIEETIMGIELHEIVDGENVPVTNTEVKTKVADAVLEGTFEYNGSFNVQTDCCEPPEA